MESHVWEKIAKRAALAGAILLLSIAIMLKYYHAPDDDYSLPDKIDPAVREGLKQNELLDVLITLKVDQADIKDIEAAQDALLEAIEGDDLGKFTKYDSIPVLYTDITSNDLLVLEQSETVLAVTVNKKVELQARMFLSSSTALIGSDRVRDELGYTGAGINIAVIDTGIDVDHPLLADSLVTQQCFVGDRCPSTNVADDGVGHGTQMAGIITSPDGVARDAGIVALRVIDDDGVGYFNETIDAINWAVSHRNDYNIKIINISLSYDNCSTLDPVLVSAFTTAFAAARNNGMLVVVPAGNGADSTQIKTPACIPGAIAVGNVYDNQNNNTNHQDCSDTDAIPDTVMCNSNSSSDMDILAPGVSILTTQRGGGMAMATGSSGSAAHASGVAALIWEAKPSLSDDEVEAILKSTGKTVVDTRNVLSFPRIDAYAAVQSVLTPDTTPQATLLATVESTATLGLSDECALCLGIDPDVANQPTSTPTLGPDFEMCWGGYFPCPVALATPTPGTITVTVIPYTFTIPTDTPIAFEWVTPTLQLWPTPDFSDLQEMQTPLVTAAPTSTPTIPGPSLQTPTLENTPTMANTPTPYNTPDLSNLQTMLTRQVTPRSTSTATPPQSLATMIPTPTPKNTVDWEPLEKVLTPYVTATVWATPTYQLDSYVTDTLTTTLSFITAISDDISIQATRIASWSNILSVTTFVSTRTFTTTNAPAEWMPLMPRKIANIAYTLILLGNDIYHNGPQNFDLASWSYLFGLMVSIPISVAKTVYDFSLLMGYYAVFVYWVLLLAPFVLRVRMLVFIIQGMRWLWVMAGYIISGIVEGIKIVLLFIEAADNLLIIGGILAFLIGVCAICGV